MAEVTAEKQVVLTPLSVRVRRVAKWAGIPVCLLFATAFAVATWTSAHWYPSSRIMLVVGNGQVTIMYCRDFYVRDFTPMSTDANPHGAGQWWWFPRFFDGRYGTWVHLPLWCVLAIAMISTARLWYRDSATYRRRHPLVCADCGYDRRGLVDGAACPECGAGAQ